MLTCQIATSFALVIANFRLANGQLNEVIATCITNNILQSECSRLFTIQFKIAYPGYDFTTPKNNDEDTRKDYDNIRTRISRAYKAAAPAVVDPAVAAPAVVDPAVAAPAVVDPTVSLPQPAVYFDAAYALVMEAMKADETLAFQMFTEIKAVHNF